MRLFYATLLVMSLLCCRLAATAQTITGVNSLVDAFTTMRKQMPVEKLYLHTDKDNYVQGDTIWLKAYLLNADYLTAASRSGLLYTELDDIDNNCVKRMLLPVRGGLSWGQIALTESDVPAGSYTLRAYTNWMRNFGEDYVFSKNIYVASSADQSRLITAVFKRIADSIKATILLTDASRKPVRLQDIKLKALNGRHTFLNAKASSGMDGQVNLNFKIPEKASVRNLSIETKEVVKGAETNSLIVPVNIVRPEYTDLQFMPEGGYLVAGVRSKIGFKAIGEDGKSVEVKGVVYNSRQQQVAAFVSAHAGMGSFELLPQPGETYTARLTLPLGAVKNYPLPAVSPGGTCLAVNRLGDDSLQVKITGSSAQAGSYYLVGQSRSVVCYAAHVTAADGVSITNMPTSLFPTGIARFTLLTQAGQPLNERMVFIDHNDGVNIKVEASQAAYMPHDSIALRLQVNAKDGTAVQGNFSMSVTDDGQVKSDSTGNNILTHLLLTSDLKGAVEEPGYYFSGRSPERQGALDNLLLTQGWTGYAWKALLNPPARLKYEAEPAFAIKGTVTNVFNKPVANANLVVLSKKPAGVAEATTGADGRFRFGGVFPIDTAVFVIQARRKSGASFNLGIQVDEFSPPVFTRPIRQVTPWYVNSDTLLLSNRSSKLAQQSAQDNLQGAGTVLKEVVIKGQKIIKDSKNLNGPGGADFVLDENDLEKVAKKSLYQLLLNRFKGFAKVFQDTVWLYKFNNHVVNLVIDGLFIQQMDLPVDLYMNSLTGEDIKGIEVMYNPKYAVSYDPDFLLQETLYKDKWLPVYFEITTYSGHGAFLNKVPGTYIYKPLAFTAAKNFYSPKYVLKQAVNGTDQRSTIYWNPYIVTDSAGTAAVSFYSADKSGTYTVTIQGADLNGQVGVARTKIVIGAKESLPQ